MNITADSLVGEVAAEAPLATRVFHRHGIDYCCGGGKPLKEICDSLEIDVENVLSEIASESESSGGESERWVDTPLGDLIDHILSVYHEGLREELPRLEGMLRKVRRVHGHIDPDMFDKLLETYLGLKEELDAHMLKEEQILFPMIRSGHGHAAQGPVSVMEHEHESAGAALKRMRVLTGEYSVPDYACNTWRALWVGLEDLERALHEHIHLENNILFPRALRS
jgi:regulator of cell morphogenesis and NO signaling